MSALPELYGEDQDSDSEQEAQPQPEEPLEDEQPLLNEQEPEAHPFPSEEPDPYHNPLPPPSPQGSPVSSSEEAKQEEDDDDFSDAAAFEEELDLGKLATFQPMEFTPIDLGSSIEDMMGKNRKTEEEEALEDLERQMAVQASELERVALMDVPEVTGDSLAVGTFEDTAPPKKKKKKKKEREELFEDEPEDRAGDRRVSWSDPIDMVSDDDLGLEEQEPSDDRDVTPPSEEDDSYSSGEEERRRRKKRRKKKKKKRRRRRREEEEAYYYQQQEQEDDSEEPQAIPELETDDDAHESDGEDEDTTESDRVVDVDEYHEGEEDYHDAAQEEEGREEEHFDDEYSREEDHSRGSSQDRSSSKGSRGSGSLEKEPKSKKRGGGILGLLPTGMFAKKDKSAAEADEETPSVEVSELSHPKDENEPSSSHDVEEGRVEDENEEESGGESGDDGSSSGKSGSSSSRSRASGEEEESSESGEVDEETGEAAPKGPLHQIQSSGMTTSQKVALSCCLFFLVFGLLILTAFLGARGALAREDDTVIERIITVAPTPNVTSSPSASPTPQPTPRPTPRPTSPPVVTTTPPTDPPGTIFSCPEGNSPLEFRIVFDSDPQDVGIRVQDEFGVAMWNFGFGSFGSFAQLQRENIFTLCLSPFQQFIFEITDEAENGLISRFGEVITGSFSLIYGNSFVTTYDGDCEKNTVRECGEYCRCTYVMLANGQGSSGSCTTDCTGGITPLRYDSNSTEVGGA